MRTFYLIVTMLLILALGWLEVVAARNVPPAEPPPAATMEYAR